MGRPFQYNRFGYNSGAQKDNSHHNVYKRKENNNRTIKSSGYSELYGEYKIPNAEVNKSSSPKENAWLNRLLCTDCFSNAAVTCQVYSWPTAQRNNSDNEPLKSTIKRAKLFNCIKEFFTRKLFQQQQNNPKVINHADSTEHWETIDDITSDYEDLDNIESSYNADEEDDYEDDCDDNCACIKASAKELYCSTSLYRKLEKSSPLRSPLSFSCCQEVIQSVRSPCEENHQPARISKRLSKFSAFESANTSEDDGISDCCQLITKMQTRPAKSSTTYCRKAKRLYGRQKCRRSRLSGSNDECDKAVNANANDDDDEDADESDECPDLMRASWFQPRITTKTVYERLRQSSPGSFLIRRKARTFELCLRSETKVKHFAIIRDTNESYKLKGAKKQFSSLNALVTHHSVMAEQLPLTLVLPRESRASCARTSLRRYNDDFDTLESLQILGILQSLQAKNCNSP